MNTAFLETWTETERGWGQRPDGCTIHLTEEDYKKYVKKYWDKMPKETPYEYSRPDENLREVVIGSKLFKDLKKSANGILLWQSEFSEKKKSNEILFKD